jgi:hypothetical protein
VAYGVWLEEGDDMASWARWAKQTEVVRTFLEYLFRIQRNGGLEIEKRIGIWIINFKPLILNLEMMYMSKKFT